MKSDVVATTDCTDFTDVRDTVREVTTITIDRNETGDTLRLTQVTERDRWRSRNQISTQQTKLEVVHDTVVIVKRDSSYVENTNLTNGTNNQSGGTALRGTLKWIFWIIIGLIGLAITVKVCLLKR